MLFKKIYQFGDKLEDRVRGKLSHYPIIYAFVGGSGIIIFWRGIWHLMDFLVEYVHTNGQSVQLPWWDGVLSIVLGATLLLLVGLFVSSFIGNEIVISGLKGEKKIVEKAEQEIERELVLDTELQVEIREITKRLERVQKILENKK
ncbi:MAG: hypothetical protein ACD_72C00358G0002 [uncultured bacterium]|nr:MAG: hypothetical protein ACD_72C00358G0002 [uncultured bacterium]